MTNLRVGKGRLDPSSRSAHYALQRSLAAYEFAKPFVKGRRVLDVGCGAGHGTIYVAGETLHLVGMDLEPAAVAYAKKAFGQPSLDFVCCNLFSPSFLRQTFDTILSFQVVEHLPDPMRYFQELNALLADGGILIMATLNREKANAGLHPDHVKEYSFDEFTALCRSYFSSASFYGLFGNERYAAAGMEEARFGRLFLRLDPWGLRHRIPRALWEWVYALCTFLVQSFVSWRLPESKSLSIHDFHISQEDLDEALDFIVICTKESS